MGSPTGKEQSRARLAKRRKKVKQFCRCYLNTIETYTFLLLQCNMLAQHSVSTTLPLLTRRARSKNTQSKHLRLMFVNRAQCPKPRDG